METKNKWVVVDESVGDMFCLAVREESTGRLIADLADHPLEATGIVERTRDEARLIAAGPGLLASCEEMKELALSGLPGNEYRWMKAIENAINIIAKAKGKGSV